MKRVQNAVLAMIIMTMLNVGNAHSGSGTFEGTTPPDKNTPKEEYPISKYEPNEPIFTAITCGGNAEIPEGERFQIVMNGEAFLDRATCLVWEMYPLKFYSIEPGLTLPETLYRCNGLETGNRNDWRVPNVFELMLLEDSIDGSERPWDIDSQCYNDNYGGVGEYHCRGWTGTPASGGPVGSYFVITMDHGSLGWKHFNDRAYPFCVRGTLHNGYYLEPSN